MGPDGGGILSLAATVREHRGALRADFRRFYAIGLDEAFHQWSIRELYDLIKHLPHDAALWAAQEANKTPQERRDESRWDAPDEPKAHRVNASQLISIAQGFGIPVG